MNHTLPIDQQVQNLAIITACFLVVYIMARGILLQLVPALKSTVSGVEKGVMRLGVLALTQIYRLVRWIVVNLARQLWRLIRAGYRWIRSLFP